MGSVGGSWAGGAIFCNVARLGAALSISSVAFLAPHRAVTKSPIRTIIAHLNQFETGGFSSPVSLFLCFVTF